MFNKTAVRSFIVAAAVLACGSAQADFVMHVGESVYVNGKRYTREEWDRMQAQPTPVEKEEAKPVEKDAKAAPAENVRPREEAATPRAASCSTTRMYDEFPDVGEKFACSANLGSLTREEILQGGWKIDLIEKLPAPAGTPATSPRGLPLSSYKLILSR